MSPKNLKVLNRFCLLIFVCALLFNLFTPGPWGVLNWTLLVLAHIAFPIIPFFAILWSFPPKRKSDDEDSENESS